MGAQRLALSAAVGLLVYGAVGALLVHSDEHTPYRTYEDEVFRPVEIPAMSVIIEPNLATLPPTQAPAPVVKPSVVHLGQPVRGTPTWYCKAGVSRCTRGYPDGPNIDLYAAAGPSLRIGDWRGRVVRVCAPSGACLSVKLIDWCACGGDHFLDLYWDAWNALGRPHSAKVSW